VGVAVAVAAAWGFDKGTQRKQSYHNDG